MQELTKTVAKQEDFVVSGVEEVRKRVYEAEKRIKDGEFLTVQEHKELVKEFFAKRQKAC